jgi:hypothetical protein
MDFDVNVRERILGLANSRGERSGAALLAATTATGGRRHANGLAFMPVRPGDLSWLSVPNPGRRPAGPGCFRRRIPLPRRPPRTPQTCSPGLS